MHTYQRESATIPGTMVLVSCACDSLCLAPSWYFGGMVRGTGVLPEAAGSRGGAHK